MASKGGAGGAGGSGVKRVPANKIDIRESMNVLLEKFGDVWMQHTKEIRENKYGNPEMVSKWLEEALARELLVSGLLVKQWVSESLEPIESVLERVSMECCLSMLLLEFLQYCDDEVKSVESGAVLRVMRSWMTRGRRLFDGRGERLVEEPDVMLRHLQDQGREWLESCEMGEQVVLEIINHWVEEEQGAMMSTVDLRRHHPELIVSDWSHNLLIFAYDNGYIFKPSTDPVSKWTAEHVASWVTNLQLAEYAEGFILCGVQGNALLELTEYEMESALEIFDEGARKRLSKGIASLQTQELQQQQSGNKGSSAQKEKVDIETVQIDKVKGVRKGWKSAAQRETQTEMVTGESIVAEYIRNRPGVVTFQITHTKLLPRDLDLIERFINGVVATNGTVILPANTTVRKIDLASCFLGPTGAASLASALIKNVRVREVSIKGNRILDAGAKAFAPVLENTKALLELNLGLNLIGDAGAKAILDAAWSNKLTRRLYLYDNLIGAGGAAAFAECAKRNRKLDVDLTENKIGNEGLVAIGAVIEVSWAFQLIDLRNCGVMADGIKALCVGLAKNLMVTSLYLSGNAFGPEGAKHIGVMLLTNGKIAELKIRECDLGDEGTLYIAKGLAGNDAILSIDLSRNNIGPSGAAAIGKVLESQDDLGNSLGFKPVLKRIQLADNRIGSRGLHSIATGLPSCNLQSLEVSINGIDDYGMQMLSSWLVKNRTVSVIDLSGNLLTADGIWYLVENALRKTVQVVSLDVSDNAIGDGGARAIANLIASNGNYKEVLLAGNRVQDAGVKALMTAASKRVQAITIGLAGNEFRAAREQIDAACAINTKLLVWQE